MNTWTIGDNFCDRPIYFETGHIVIEFALEFENGPIIVGLAILVNRYSWLLYVSPITTWPL